MLTKSTTVTEPGYMVHIPLDIVPIYPIYDNPHVEVHYFVPPLTRLYEKMRTTTAADSKDRWNDCEHYKCRQLPIERLSGVRVLSGKWSLSPNFHQGFSMDAQFGYMGYSSEGTLEWFGDAGRPLLGLDAWYVEHEDGSFTTPPSWLGSMVQASLEKMLPEIKARMSLVNSVLELKDFKNLITTARKVFADKGNRIYSLHKVISESLYGPKRLTLAEAIESGAGKYLQWSFAWKPLIQDISSLYAALRETESDLRKLLNRAGTLQTRHWSRTVGDITHSRTSSIGQAIIPNNDFPGNVYVIDRDVVMYPSRFHAEIQYCYQYTEYQLAHSRVLALLDAFGVNLDPAIIWNAIPWTFVVDWVLNVGSFLSSLKVTNMKPLINIRRFLCSYKNRRQIRLIRREVDVMRISSRPCVTQAPMPVVEESTFRRYTQLPTQSSLQASGLTSQEVILGAALAVSLNARRRKTQTLRSIRIRMRRFPPTLPRWASEWDPYAWYRS